MTESQKRIVLIKMKAYILSFQMGGYSADFVLERIRALSDAVQFEEDKINTKSNGTIINWKN